MAHLSWMVTSNTLLPEPLWSGHSGDRVRVLNFMAAYGREIADKRYDGPAAALSLLMCKSQYSHVLYSLQAASLVNRHDQQPPVAVRDYISCVCSAAKLGHWCERMRQCTRKQFNSALRRQTTHHKRQCRCRPPTTRDFKGSCRRLSRGPQQVTHGRPIERIASFKCTVCGLMSFLDTQLWEI